MLTALWFSALLFPVLFSLLSGLEVSIGTPQAPGSYLDCVCYADEVSGPLLISIVKGFAVPPSACSWNVHLLPVLAAVPPFHESPYLSVSLLTVPKILPSPRLFQYLSFGFEGLFPLSASCIVLLYTGYDEHWVKQSFHVWCRNQAVFNVCGNARLRS